MSGLNRAFLLGHLGQDPELRTTQSGQTMVSFSLATPHAKKVNEEWIDAPDWHRIKAFGRDAEFICKYAHKGAMVGVECAIRQNKWTDKNGNPQSGVDLIVERILCVNDKQRVAAIDVPASPVAGPAPVAEDAIPF